MFELKCSEEIFSEDELEILDDFGEYYENLIETLNPQNKDEQHFLDVIEVLDINMATNEIEALFVKYLKRIEIEKESDFKRSQRPKDKIVTTFEVDPTCGRGGCD